MVFFWSFVIMNLSGCLYYSFAKKLLAILFLEALMLSLIIFLCLFCHSMLFNPVLLFYLSVIMVLESVFAISLFVSTSRNSSFESVPLFE